LSRRALWVLVVLLCSAAALAQAPVNVEQAVRLRSQPEASASVELICDLPAMSEDTPTKAVDLLITEQGSSAQLHELGSLYSLSKDNAVQLHELGSLYSLSKDNAVQLHELGSLYSLSKD
jgi:hypothetical protein